MILDTARISLEDGSQVAAIDVQPGRNLAAHKKRRTVVKDRIIETRLDVVGLVLSNGNKLCASMDQRVALVRTRNTCYRPLSDVQIGDMLRGETAGIPTVIRVLGILLFPKQQARLVGFRVDLPFIAEGVLCRS